MLVVFSPYRKMPVCCPNRATINWQNILIPRRTADQLAPERGAKTLIGRL
jgi:hypothetical protein